MGALSTTFFPLLQLCRQLHVALVDSDLSALDGFFRDDVDVQLGSAQDERDHVVHAGHPAQYSQKLTEFCHRA